MEDQTSHVAPPPNLARKEGGPASLTTNARVTLVAGSTIVETSTLVHNGSTTAAQVRLEMIIN